MGDELSTRYKLKWDDPPQTITLSLNRAANVKLVAVKPEVHCSPAYGIYDISFS